MSMIKTTLKELWGLFVDDGAMAVGLLVWCALAGLVSRVVSLPAGLAGPLFCLGCLAVLVGSVVAAARRMSQR